MGLTESIALFGSPGRASPPFQDFSPGEVLFSHIHPFGKSFTNSSVREHRDAAIRYNTLHAPFGCAAELVQRPDGCERNAMQ
jgi:hypothetical protein